MSINIVVCVKQVHDPEGPAESFEVDGAGLRVTARGVHPTISPFDENALEAAIRIKESVGAKITLVSLGESHSKAVILKAMATGADDVVLIQGERLDHQRLDSHATARVLAAAIRKLESYDLVLTGRQAADTNAGQVGTGIAWTLGVPVVTVARKIEVADGKVFVETVLPDGYQFVESPLPAVVTVSHEVGELRYPSLAAIKGAKNLPQLVLSPDELDIDSPGEVLVRAVSLEAPSRERACTLVEEDTPEDTGRKLAEVLREDKVI